MERFEMGLNATRAGRSAGRPCGGAPAFSLIELLVVIVVVAILSSIVISVVHGARNRAHMSQCASNLRQIGAAIQLYGIDNEGRLPGPAYVALSRRTVVTRNLIRHIRDYVPLVVEGEEMCLLPICPTAEVFYNGDNEGLHYRRLTRIMGRDGETFDPFGYAANSKGMTVSEISDLAVLSASDIPLIYDHDQQNGVSSKGPQSPIHNGYRNYLFLDNHVESLQGRNPFESRGVMLE